jgi:hypothetical protein
MRIEVPPASVEDLDHWCREHLGSGIKNLIFQTGHLSSVSALLLDDLRKVAIKVRPGSSRLEDCISIQSFLWQNGYPAPRPLLPPKPFGPYVATAERLSDPGETLPPGPEAAPAFAEALYELVRICRGYPTRHNSIRRHPGSAGTTMAPASGPPRTTATTTSTR